MFVHVRREIALQDLHAPRTYLGGSGCIPAPPVYRDGNVSTVCYFCAHFSIGVWETNKKPCTYWSLSSPTSQELCTGGELFERLAKKEFYTEGDARSVMRTLVISVGYMHAQGIVHRYAPINPLWYPAYRAHVVRKRDVGSSLHLDGCLQGLLPLRANAWSLLSDFFVRCTEVCFHCLRRDPILTRGRAVRGRTFSIGNVGVGSHIANGKLPARLRGKEKVQAMMCVLSRLLIGPSLSRPIRRDLKPENVLLKNKDSDTEIRIADFGFAQHVTLGSQGLKDITGSPGYLAPEIIKGEAYNYKVWRVDTARIETLFQTVKAG